MLGLILAFLLVVGVYLNSVYITSFWNWLHGHYRRLYVKDDKDYLDSNRISRMKKIYGDITVAPIMFEIPLEQLEHYRPYNDPFRCKKKESLDSNKTFEGAGVAGGVIAQACVTVVQQGGQSSRPNDVAGAARNQYMVPNKMIAEMMGHNMHI